MIARPTPLAPTEEVHALLALVACGGACGDERLRALLLALRRAKVAEVRAIEHFLNISPARSERGVGREAGEEGRR